VFLGQEKYLILPENLPTKIVSVTALSRGGVTLREGEGRALGQFTDWAPIANGHVIGNDANIPGDVKLVIGLTGARGA